MNKLRVVLLGLTVALVFAVGWLTGSASSGRDNPYHLTVPVESDEKSLAKALGGILNEFKETRQLSDNDVQVALRSHIRTGFAQPLFMKGGVINSAGGRYTSDYTGDRNAITVMLTDKRPGKTYYFGSRNTRVLVLLDQKGVAGSLELQPQRPLEDLDFILFEPGHVYQFNWRSIQGISYPRDRAMPMDRKTGTAHR